MILIRVRFYAPNSKLMADDGRGHKITIPFNYDKECEDNDLIAAQTLADKYFWGAVEYVGTYKEERYYRIKR